MSGDIRESSGVMGGMGKSGLDPTVLTEVARSNIVTFQLTKPMLTLGGMFWGGVLVRLANVPQDLFGCKFFPCHSGHVFASHLWNGCMVIKSDLLL